LVIVVLFGFLNIKSVKIYAIQLIFSTTLLLYKLDTLLFKDSNGICLKPSGCFPIPGGLAECGVPLSPLMST
jgi:hypothetical protein